MKDIIKIIEEVKELEIGTMLYIFIFAISCFLFDFFFLRFNVAHTLWLNIFRSIYLILGVISHIFLIDRWLKYSKRKKQEQKIHLEQEKQLQEHLEQNFREIEVVMHRMSAEQTLLLERFVRYNTTAIDIFPQELNTINFIGSNGLCGIKILTFPNPPRYQATITGEVLELLKFYFSYK